jgi:hypothetical protein
MICSGEYLFRAMNLPHPEVFTPHPNLTSGPVFGGQVNRKRKDDRVDAQKIFELLKGHVLAGNGLPEIWIPDHQNRDDREIVRSSLDAGHKLTAV